MRRGLVAGCALALLSGCTSGDGTTTASTPPSTAFSLLPATSASSGPVRVPADWPTYHGTPDRSGVARTMPAVSGTPKVVASVRLDGAVYASPVIVGGTVVVATERNVVYALDLTGRTKWQRRLGTPADRGELPCGNIDPLGITGTPIVQDGTVYLSPELGSPPRHDLVALDLRTGAVTWRRSIDLPGVDTAAMQERGALTIAGGRVWVPFGGLAGDCGGYKGRVVGVRLDGTGAPIAYTVPTTREAGIWTPPGPSVDRAGNLFVQVGNGESGPGDPYDHSDSVLKVGTKGQLLDSFSPTRWASDNAGDLDLGSQGPALVGTRWVFAAGKSGIAYVLDQHRLGGIGGEVGRTGLCRSYGGTAVDGSVVYVPCDDGLRAVRIDAAGRMHQLWLARPAGSPVVGGGRVWTLDTGAGTLLALDPATGEPKEQVHVGDASRFATPALYGRYVLVGTLDGLAVVRTS
ncbi:MAG: PQQ-binding-like beta-propeller repeat protein [Jatrophihabitantaceae bacterium]